MKKFLLSIVAVVLLTASYAQFTRQEAIDLVLNSLVTDDIGKIDVFSKTSSHSGADSLLLMNEEKIKASYENNWVFFVDDHIYSDWFHDCRFIFVNTLNGEYTIVNQQIYTQDFKVNYENIELAPRYEPEYQANSIDYSPTQLEPNLHSYAMIVCAEDEEKYWNSASLIYLTLLEQGYTKENIFIHYGKNGTSAYGSDLDGDGNFGDIDFSATLYDFALSMDNFSAVNGNHPNHPVPQLEEEDQFSMFFVGVPTSYECGLGECYYLWSNDGQSYAHVAGVSLGSILGTIRAIQQNILLAVNYGGLFSEYLTDPYSFQLLDNRYIHTPSGDNYSTTHDEIWITGGKYNEYIFYWAAAMRGIYPDPYLEPWSVFATTGQFPFDQYFDNHPEDYIPNIDNDAYIQMDEAFSYADNQNTWSNDTYYFNPYVTGENENPQEWDSFPFEEGLITLTGLAGKINNTQSIDGRKYLIGGNLDIIDGTLTLEEETELFFGNELANLTVEDNASLIVENDVSFYGNQLNHINVDGFIQIGQNVSFSKGYNTGNFSGLYLNHHQLNTTLNYASFTESGLQNYGGNLTITNSIFDDCYIIYSYRGNVNISNECSFTDTWLHLENQSNDPDMMVSVKNSTFNNAGAGVGIDVWNYGKYFIENNNINAVHNGIQILNSGEGNSGNQLIFNNEISGCDMSGIIAYNTTGTLANNYIHNNNFGIKLLNNCNIALAGNAAASSNSETNFITNNDDIEIYISKYSFPWYFHYNVIIDEDNVGNPNDPLLYFAYDPSGKVNKKDIRYNCWGNNFDANEDLYPVSYLNYSPTWCPNGTPIETGIAEQLYLDGREQSESQQYNDAKATFLLLIEQFPKTEYAMSAMKELIILEKYVDNDYVALKNYFQTNEKIQLDTTLQKLSQPLSTKCDIKLENWQNAIDYYESIIVSPETIEDSVFAIIDLGYVYFLMENGGNKSAYSGQLTEFIPKSRETFFEHRDYLLSLLPGDRLSKTMKGDIASLKEGELLQNIPNPFTGSTQIWYKLKSESDVKLKIYNSIGQLISTINQGLKTEGTHHFDFNANGLKKGIYFYTISINGQTIDSKKMTIMK